MKSSVFSVMFLVAVAMSLLLVLSGCPTVKTITTLAELRKIGTDSAFPLDGQYKLAANIDVAGATLVPIGNVGTAFTGTFDGAGFSIRNAVINGDRSVGLFAVSTGTVQNLKMENLKMTATWDVGGVVGTNLGAIKNCSVQGQINADSWAGLIAGNNTGAISGCTAKGAVTGINSDCGGVVGGNAAQGIVGGPMNIGSLSACSADVVVKVAMYGGGIAGHTAGPISNCTAAGTVAVSLMGGGGIVGLSQKASAVMTCVKSTITPTGPKDVGPIAGSYYDGAPPPVPCP